MVGDSGIRAGGEPKKAPRVWLWYRVLCVGIAIVNLGLAGFGVWLIRSVEWIVSHSLTPDRDRGLLVICGVALVIMGAAFAALNIVLLALPLRPWAYLLHFVNAFAAVFLCLPAPLALPVLFYWAKPEVREMFGYTLSTPP